MDSIFLLDDDLDLAQAMSQLIEILKKIHCFYALSFAQMEQQSAAVLLSSLCILDINLGMGKPSGIDAYNWLRQKDFKGKIVFFTGHASDHPLVKKVAKLENVQILSKPLDIAALNRIIDDRQTNA